MGEGEIKRNRVRLAPLVRLSLSFDRELNLDDNQAFNKEFYHKYIERHLEAEAKLNKTLRALLMVNTIMFLVLNGQDWTIPFAKVQVSKIPAIQEILLFYSSMTFFFVCSTFVTKQCYSVIIDQCGNRIVNNDRVDPDFYNAASKYFEFFLKLYRPKLNIWGIDFFKHGWGFTVFSLVITLILLTVVMVIPIVHIVLIVVASMQAYQTDWNEYAKLLLIGSVVLMNFGGLAMVFGMNKNFDFFEIEHPAEQKTESELKKTPPD
ncbi:MAG: hypothetical protein V7723_10715 [Sneathiella sp.]|uniref:hypothetical protein n=1 Tax=Sneathiella sp. TaxID=1964365 RepID=UPI0030016957